MHGFLHSGVGRQRWQCSACRVSRWQDRDLGAQRQYKTLLLLHRRWCREWASRQRASKPLQPKNLGQVVVCLTAAGSAQKLTMDTQSLCNGLRYRNDNDSCSVPSRITSSSAWTSDRHPFSWGNDPSGLEGVWWCFHSDIRDQPSLLSCTAIYFATACGFSKFHAGRKAIVLDFSGGTGTATTASQAVAGAATPSGPEQSRAAFQVCFALPDTPCIFLLARLSCCFPLLRISRAPSESLGHQRDITLVNMKLLD